MTLIHVVWSETDAEADGGSSRMVVAAFRFPICLGKVTTYANGSATS
jgi:hypothetical protein